MSKEPFDLVKWIEQYHDPNLTAIGRWKMLAESIRERIEYRRKNNLPPHENDEALLKILEDFMATAIQKKLENNDG